jgi:transposase-like protein
VCPHTDTTFLDLTNFTGILAARRLPLASGMQRFSRPVESIRPGRFRPPFCPRRDCRAHRIRRGFRWRRAGHYRRPARPIHRISRFRCLSCKRTFSRQSFCATYYLKRPELLQPIAAGLVAGSAHRQIARSLGCAPSTVTRLAARIGRHALLLQALALGQLGPLDESAVMDHLETFVFSQDDRLGIATPVGQESWFVYTMDPAPHARAGPRSARRRPRLRPLPDKIPQPMLRSTRRVVDLLLSLSGGTLDLVSDDHPVYPAAIAARRVRGIVRHRVYANPPRGPQADPAVARERDRQMFPVDLLHKLWRHSQAHHRRETIAFGRRSNALLERAALLMIWRNFVKGVSERSGDRTTPAMRLGLLERPLGWAEIFARRLFPGRIRLPEGWMKIYRRRWITPAVGRNQRHALRHAF